MKLYTSNWIWNASVTGFLNTVKELMVNGEEVVDQLIKGEEYVEIEPDLKDFLWSDFNTSSKYNLKPEYEPKLDENRSLPKIGWMFITSVNPQAFKEKIALGQEEEGFTKNFNNLFSNAGPYKNFINTQIKDKKQSILKLFSKPKIIENGLICSFCNQRMVPENNSEKNDYQISFNLALFPDIGGSYGKFPNANFQDISELLICPTCSQFLLFRHTGFEDIFINSTSFNLMYKLNQLVKNMEKIDRKEFLIQAQTSEMIIRNSWTLSNTEIIERKKIKRPNKKQPIVIITFNNIPDLTAKLFVSPVIISYLQKITHNRKITDDKKITDKEQNVMEYIISSDFSKILKLAYKELKDDYTPYYEIKIYTEIQKILGGEQMKEKVISVENLYYEGKNCKNGDLIESLNRNIFKILEMVRLGKKAQTQYTILRIFASFNEKIPENLSRIFNPQFPEDLFQAGMYNFLTGIKNAQKKEEE